MPNNYIRIIRYKIYSHSKMLIAYKMLKKYFERLSMF